MNREMKLFLINALAALATLSTLLLLATTLAAAASTAAFNAECGPGTVTITTATSAGPTAAEYTAPCTGSRLGQSTVSGTLAVQGPGNCGGVCFTALHKETITGNSGDILTLSIMENSCQSATNPDTFNCAGSYTVSGASGSLADFVGSSDKWAATVTFAGFIIDTHLHADHVSGNRLLAERTDAPIYLQATADVAFPFQSLRDGDVLELGELLLTVIETPGHRPESLSLLVTNPPRSREPSMVLTGDCLFAGDVGRPDFGGLEVASDSYRSLGRLLALEDYVEIFPAHFEGSCGRGMCGRPSSTIGFEHRFSPMLQLPSEAAFIRELTAARLPKPLNIDAIVATNRGTAELSWAMLRQPPPEVRDLTAAEALARIERAEYWLLDVREDYECRQRHLPGTHNIPQS